MKKFFSRIQFVSAMLVGLLAFGIGTSELAAQGNPQTILKSAPSNWLAPGDALDALNQEITILDAQLQGTPYVDLEYKRKYYVCVQNSIEQGQHVGAAVNDNLARFVPGLLDRPTVEMPNPLPLATWQGIYQQITDLLKA